MCSLEDFLISDLIRADRLLVKNVIVLKIYLDANAFLVVLHSLVRLSLYDFLFLYDQSPIYAKLSFQRSQYPC